MSLDKWDEWLHQNQFVLMWCDTPTLDENGRFYLAFCGYRIGDIGDVELMEEAGIDQPRD